MAFDPSKHHLDLPTLNARFENEPLENILRWCWEEFGAQAAIGTSFQGAGIVIMHHAAEAKLPFPVFTLDTGLLFPETLDLKAELEERLGIVIEPVKPEMTLDEQEQENGPRLWERNPDLCCALRKVMPLQRHLAALDVWITGVRRDQSDTRSRTGILELYKFDVLRNLNILKLNPLANWSREQVWEYLRANNLPHNKLHDQGYRSIGCIPCTKPVGHGENERAGRWTGFNKSECGIHTFLGENI